MDDKLDTDKPKIETTYSNVAKPSAASSRPWIVHWRSPSMMAVCLVVGIASSLAHHHFYKLLSNTAVEQAMVGQTWALRVGTGLALLVKTALGETATIVFTQLIWAKLRERAISIKGIDSVFAITRDVTAFFNLDLLANAKTLTLLAVVLWCLPLVTTITPATLTVGLQSVESIGLRAVPYINSSWDGPMAVWVNSHWDEPTSLVVRLLTASATTLSNLPLTPPSENASYTLDMYGPALSCSNSLSQTQETYLLNTVADANKALQESGGCTYLGTQFPLNTSIQSDMMTPPLLVYTRDTQSQNLACDYYNATYKVQFDFLSGVQTMTILDRTLLNKFFDISTAAYLQRPSQSICTKYNTSNCPMTYSPTGGCCLERRPASQLSSYAAIARVFQRIVGGFTGRNAYDLITVNSTSILATAIAACPEFSGVNGLLAANQNDVHSSQTGLSPSVCRNGSIALTMEDLMSNFTLSLLASSEVVAQSSVHYANVTINSLVNFYAYDSRNLLLTYGMAILITLLFVVLGARAFDMNGISSSTSFSSILLTTRNQTLDDLATGYALGSQPLNKAIGATKLRFGIIGGKGVNGESERKVGFGLDSEVTALTKGDVVA